MYIRQAGGTNTGSQKVKYYQHSSAERSRDEQEEDTGNDSFLKLSVSVPEGRELAS